MKEWDTVLGLTPSDSLSTADVQYYLIFHHPRYFLSAYCVQYISLDLTFVISYLVIPL